MPSLLGAALLAPEAVLFAERDEPFRRDHRRPRTAPRSKTTSRAPAPEDTFFRIIKGATPALSDFYSHRRLFGAKARPWNVSAEEWDSISMFQRRADARRQARATPAIGTHIAVVDLRRAPHAKRLQTPQEGNSHWDISDRPSRLLRAVVGVSRVEPRRRRALRVVE